MAKKLSTAEKIRRHLAAHPNAKPKQVAEAIGVSAAYVSVLKATEKKKRLAELVHNINQGHRVNFEGKILMQGRSDALPVTMEEPSHDPVNHPAHYKVGGIETIDFIEAKKLNYNLGNVVKYVTRADHKGERRENLEKALWYLKRELGI